MKLKKIITHIICSFFIICLFCSCVNIPVANENDDIQAKEYVAHEDSAILYIFENIDGVSMKTVQIEINKNEIGPIKNKSYYKVEIKNPQKITLRTNVSDPNKLVITAEKGEIYFIEVKSVLDSFLGSYIFVVSNGDDAKKRIRSAKLIKNVVLE